MTSFVQTSMFNSVISFHLINYCGYVALGLLGIKLVFYQTYTMTEFLFIFICILTALLTWYFSKSTLALYMIMFMISSKDVNKDKIIEWYFWIGLIMLTIIIVSSQLNIIPDLKYIRDGGVRHSFGIIYPTDFASHIFYLILAYCYLFFEKLNWKRYSFFVVIAVFLYIFSDARLDTLCILAIIPIMYFIKLKCKIINYYWFAPILLAVIISFSTVLYGLKMKIFYELDSVLSSRLSLGSTGFTDYGLQLFGNHIMEYGWGGESGIKAYKAASGSFKYFMIDSSFIRLQLIYGVIFTILIMFIITRASFKATLQQKYVFCGILLLLSLSSVVDQHMLEIAYNPFLILCMSFIFEHEEKVRGNQLG